MSDQLVCKVLRNRGAVLVQRRTWRGEEQADVRFYFSDPHDGTLQPSPKGVALKPTEVRHVAAALLQIADALDAEAT